ncbi:MAG: acyl-CoA dehydrogenase [Proteobacteria bacterium]|nr:acyl-CoA dehydrogenase [Pseudomonadota bacterium]
MASKFYSQRNLDFLLYEMLDLASLTKHEYFKDHNKKMFDMVLKEAGKLAKDLFFPVFEEMDRQPPELVDGEVQVHPSMKKILKEFGAGGWLNSSFSYEHHGDQLPFTLTRAASFVFSAANYSAGAYMGLITGATGLILEYGSQELQELYVEKMLGGEWQGTMALTEPEAGSSLSDITTLAEPTDQDYHLIKGQKIFISAGDHNAVDNVVHLMLAKIVGAPPGVKGISLFVVPKKRFDDEGKLISNDVVTSGVYHKLGYRGCPLTQLSLGDKGECRGWLVGEAHQGLRYMFKMMNEARIDVGLGAVSKSTAAYYAALEYSKTRLQGRKMGQKDPTQPQVPIIDHADVRRMLLFQRAVNEGSLALLLQASKYVDLQSALPDGEEKDKVDLLLELLIPIVKSYPSEMGVQAISQGLQCLGGSGFCDDYPLEQYYRDIRIDPIHEGTTGIQGMDLLGRKVPMKDGQAMMLFLEEINQAISRAKTDSELSGPAGKLGDALKTLQDVTAHLLSLAGTKGPEVFLADATLYLELFGIVTIAWQWLLQGLSVQEAMKGKVSKADESFYKGKLFTLRYFFGYELPKIEGLARCLMDTDYPTVEIETDCFAD